MKTCRADKKGEYFKGCLVGGAIGDALGYPVEFDTYPTIIKHHGSGGIRRFDLAANGKALISDDTQMTLFTASGILSYKASTIDGESGKLPREYIYGAYLDWLKTQGYRSIIDKKGTSWLSDVPELNDRRAPGNTCLSALTSKEKRSVANPINTSKGCGGVMRIAPIGLFFGDRDKSEYLNEAAEVGALTHGNPLSHLSCALMAGIIGRIIYDLDPSTGEYYDDLFSVVADALSDVNKYLDCDKKEQFDAVITKALDLVKNDKSDIVNIEALGEGWIAEEAIAISVYCACKYQSEPVEGIIAAVNHGGDSDSTGAITGNILGALHGVRVFPPEYTENLELLGVIEETAFDLAAASDGREYATKKYR